MSGDAPDFVEVGEEGIAVEDAMRHQHCVQLVWWRFGLMRCERSSESWQVLVGFQSTEAFGRLQHAGGSPAQCHRGIRHRFTLRQARRTVPIMFSIELVQASERRSFAGSPRRLMVSISSSPSRKLAATPGVS